MPTTAREKKITASSGKVFTDLGFDEAEAQVLALRADLMAQLEKQIKARKMANLDTHTFTQRPPRTPPTH